MKLTSAEASIVNWSAHRSTDELRSGSSFLGGDHPERLSGGGGGGSGLGEHVHFHRELTAHHRVELTGHGTWDTRYDLRVKESLRKGQCGGGVDPGIGAMGR